MHAELICEPLPIRQPTAWQEHAGKQVMVVYSSHDDRQLQFTVGCLAAAAALAVAGTSISYRLPVVDLEKVGSPSPIAVVAREEEAQPSVSSMLQSIRKRTALTWEQLAAIFAVSRRAVHLWAGGNAVTAQNRHKVRSLLDEAVALGDVEPFVARSRLLDQHGVGAVIDRLTRSEPILVADQAPLSADSAVRRTPITRVRHG